MYVYIYVHIYICVYVYIYIYNTSHLSDTQNMTAERHKRLLSYKDVVFRRTLGDDDPGTSHQVEILKSQLHSHET